MHRFALVAAPEYQTAVNCIHSQPLEGGLKGAPTGLLFTANCSVGGEMGEVIIQALRKYQEFAMTGMVWHQIWLFGLPVPLISMRLPVPSP